MKFGDMRSVGHNIADSLASGIGLPIGIYMSDVFGDAERAPGGGIAVDFLTGTCSEGASAALAGASLHYRDFLVELCRKHGATPSVFRTLSVRYSNDVFGRRFVVTVENVRGRRAVDEYLGVPGKRRRVLDRLGRVRRA